MFNRSKVLRVQTPGTVVAGVTQTDDDGYNVKWELVLTEAHTYRLFKQAHGGERIFQGNHTGDVAIAITQRWNGWVAGGSAIADLKSYSYEAPRK